jgi:nucleoid-associated protein YgaU
LLLGPLPVAAVLFTAAGNHNRLVDHLDEFTDIGRIEYNTYTWKEGDRLDQVAMNFYSNPERWWLIAEYNPEVSDHQNIPAGTVLRIPSV